MILIDSVHNNLVYLSGFHTLGERGYYTKNGIINNILILTIKNKLLDIQNTEKRK